MKYSLAQRVMHWLMALAIISLLVVGNVMEDLSGDLRYQVYGLHKSFGVLVLILLAWRLAFRVYYGVPVLPQKIPTIEKMAAAVGHKLLYILMLLMPLSGYVMSNAKGHDVALFGLELPRLVAENKILGAFAAEAHEVLAWALVAVIVGHSLALVWHYQKQQLNLLRRMW